MWPTAAAAVSHRPPVSAITDVGHRRCRPLPTSAITNVGHRRCRPSLMSGMAHIGHH
jgi:hypothetical protein